MVQCLDWNDLEIQWKWQGKWESAKAFQPSIEKGKEKFFFTVPYPYVSGLLHVGHGRTYTNGDVIARFKRMQGFNVLWPMAFHITGTPVLAISAKLSAGDADTTKMFEEYVGIYQKEPAKIKEIVGSFADPWKLVNYFSEKLVGDFASMGYSLDFSRQFTTGDLEYNKLIEWQFHKYKQKGFLKQASYPILYCLNDKNAVGEDDIKEADTVPVEMQHFVSFKYQLEGSDAFLITCTLRPDTAYGILNLYANPSTVYVKALVSHNGNHGTAAFKEQWIASRQFCEKLATQGYQVKILEEVEGSTLIAKWCIDHFGNKRPIFPASFADPDICSGIVHSSARAPVDYFSLQELKADEKSLLKYPGLREQVASVKIPNIVDLPGFSPVAAKDIAEKMGIRNSREHDKIKKATVELYRLDHQFGVMTSMNGQFAGMKVSDAKVKIAEFLKKEGKSIDFYENSRPAVCRCGGKVVCAVLDDQWFIDYKSAGWKEKAHECLDEMTIYPEVYRKQFQDVFEWLDKRPCARRRGLGTKFPFAEGWIVESLSDSTIYMAFYTIIKNIRGLGVKPDQLSQEFFDFVFLGVGDVGKVAQATGIGEQVLKQIRDEFLYWYPNDLRHTGIAHITNHLSFFVFAHAAIFEKRHWPKAISLNEFILSEGSKMSKSKGNVVLLNTVAGAGMADVFRFYIVGSAEFSSVLNYRARDVEVARKNLNRLVSVLSSLVQTRNEMNASSQKGVSNAYAWMASKFEKAVRESTKALEEFRLRDYVQFSVHELLKDYDYFSKRANQQERNTFAAEYTKKWIALVAPLVPHSAEELWERVGCKQFVSLSAWPTANEKLIVPQVELREDLVGQVISDARSIVQMLSRKPGKKFSKVTVVVASKAKWGALLDAIAFKSAKDASNAVDHAGLKEYVLKEFYALQYKLASESKAVDEGEVLEQAKQFIEKELNLQFAVEQEEGSSSQKAGKAMPLKPAIILE